MRVVKEEGPKSPGFVPVKRWAKAMVCKCFLFDVDWAEIGQALAATLGQKGIVSIIPFMVGKGLFLWIWDVLGLRVGAQL